MARTALKILFGFLSTAGFVAAFALAGDVLLAAMAAVTIAIVQFVFGQTTQAKPGMLMWVSLAFVIGLTSLSLRGDDALGTWSPELKVNSIAPDCTCNGALSPLPVRAVPGLLTPDTLKTLALTGRSV